MGKIAKSLFLTELKVPRTLSNIQRNQIDGVLRIVSCLEMIPAGGGYCIGKGVVSKSRFRLPYDQVF
ncbi:MAG TPA: hypothetical protein VJ768_08150, partial [Anaerolineales bacterium]|nr:hypothetical protein [Anaerolineales bacterium]